MDRDDREHFKTMSSASRKPPTGSKNESSAKGSPHSRHDPHSCLARAKRIFSCYRRDEAQDPEGFVANLGLVLGDYPASIVDLAADPRTGIITAFPMGLPNVGQIRQFLEDKLSHREKLERLGSLPKPDFTRLPKPPAGPGAFANVKVPRDYPRYAALWARTQAEGSDRREWKVEHGELYVALSWIEEPQKMPAQRFTAPTDEALRDLYPPTPAAEQGEVAA